MTTLTDTKPDRLPFIEWRIKQGDICIEELDWLVSQIRHLRGELITTEIEAFAAGMESRQDNEVQQ